MSTRIVQDELATETATARALPLYKNSAAALEHRVTDLLVRLTTKEKAALVAGADRILRERLDNAGLRFGAIRTELLGCNATHGPLTAQAEDDVALQQLLGKFPPQGRVDLETIMEQVRTGAGTLSDAELTFLFLQEFKKDLKPAL